MPDSENGHLRGCGINEDFRALLLDNIKKVDIMHLSMPQLVRNTTHLEKLDSLELIRDKLIEKATSKAGIDSAIVLAVIGVLGTVILGLVIVIIFLLTGAHYGILGSLHT